MTYKQLAESLAKLSPEQLNMDVTVSCDVSEEAFPVNYFHCVQQDDMLGNVLDEGHPILAIAY